MWKTALVTNIQKLIALKFATASGLLLKLCQYHEKYEVTKFECASFSCFPEEQEILFFGGETLLKIKGALQWVGDVLMKYDRFMEPINAFSRMMNGLSMKEQDTMNNAKSQRAMKVLIKDILRSLVLKQHECESPKYIQDLVLFHHASTPRVRLIYDELFTEYKWLDCILKKVSGDILNIINIAVLFCHSDGVVFMMPDEYVLSDAESGAMIDDMVMISEMALALKISFVWKSGMPQDARSNLRNAFLGLYGKDCEYHFDANSVSFTFEDAAIDAEAQEAIESQIESMIQQLSIVVPKAKIEKKQTAQIARRIEGRDYYRANTEPNSIEFEDEDHFHHQFDPLGDLTDVVMETDLIKNNAVDVSFVAVVIVSFVGYTESNLSLPSKGSGFGCTKHDVEQCYFISFSPNCKYSAYWLKQFRCEVRGVELDDIYCATMLVWNREQVMEGNEEIVWQSEMRSLELRNHEPDDRDIVDFEMNVKCDTDKIYLIKIDVPEGRIGCDRVQSKDIWPVDGQQLLLHARMHLNHNQFSDRSYNPHKFYSVSFTC